MHKMENKKIDKDKKKVETYEVLTPEIYITKTFTTYPPSTFTTCSEIPQKTKLPDYQRLL